MTQIFVRYLERQADRDDPVGDLAKDWKHDDHRERYFSKNLNPSLKSLWSYLGSRFACEEARETLIDAYREWQGLGNTYRASQTKRPLGWLRLRFRVLKRDGYRCQLCGRTAQDGVKLEVDHKVARHNGGSDDPSNLHVLCFPCNRGKRADNL